MTRKDRHVSTPPSLAPATAYETEVGDRPTPAVYGAPTDADRRALHDRLDSLAAQVRSGMLGTNAALALACVAGWEWHAAHNGAEIPGRPR